MECGLLDYWTLDYLSRGHRLLVVSVRKTKLYAYYYIVS